MNKYSEGMSHGWEDSKAAVRRILAMDIPDAEKLEQITRQVEPMPGIDSSLHTCPGCGAKVIGHERCGDPTRAECSAV